MSSSQEFDLRWVRAVATMDLLLPNALRAWVEMQVESGRYVDANDYIRQLIRSDQTKSESDGVRLAELHELVAVGLADQAAGRVVDADHVFDRLEAKYAAMEPDRKAG